MHPILAQPVRLAMYVGVWIGFGALLAAVITIGNEATLLWALEFAVPLGILLGFESLSSWYLVRALPVPGTPPSRLLGTWMSAGLVLLAVWTLIGFVWANYLIPPESAVSMANVPTRVI